MKRIVSILFLLLTGLGVWAQNRIPQLDRARGRRVQFHYVYSLSKAGTAFSPVTEGDAVVEDGAYRLSGLGLDVTCDGTTRWTRDREAQELVIETVDTASVLDNPALLMATYERYADVLHVQGATDTSLDVVLDVDQDVRVRFVLTGLSYTDCQGKSDFSLDEKSLSKEYVVTDLR